MDRYVAAMDIGDLIYFALIIIGGLASLIKKNKQGKSKPAQTTPEVVQESNEPKDIFQDILREIKETSFPTQTAPKPKVVQIEKEPVVSKPKPVTSYSFKKEADSDVKTPQNEPIFNEVVEPYKSPQLNYRYQGVDKQLDMRELIIANAILNRPYD